MKGLIDSTLREGSQTFGLAFNLAQKKEIFAGLCSVGIEEIEIGIATPLDEDLPSLIKFCRGLNRTRRLALWCRCRHEDIVFARSLQPDVLSLSIPVSDIHIERKLNRDRQWALETARKSILTARQLGFKVVSLGLEDATRADHEFLKEIIKTANSCDVGRIRLADTVGIASPLKIASLVQYVKNLGPMEVGVHAHNDFGMATANSLAALDAGADWADATVLGLGERAGNARLEELAGYLALQRSRRYKLERLKDLTLKVGRMSGRTIEPHNPIVGEKIFYCETGLHLQGLNKDTAIYEPFSPKIVGATRKFRYGSKIGKNEVLSLLGEMKKTAANINVDEIVLTVRRKAGVLGRPLKRRELLSLITSVFNS
ncbi:MAG: hypothetical protein AMJ61_09730 [Desulfobacterales bacterium SG8_35_2]|nr:MAG: hypothetical protein AMJ61_09730 [Desulfobacterales bacterium SG8_35_2]